MFINNIISKLKKDFNIIYIFNLCKVVNNINIIQKLSKLFETKLVLLKKVYNLCKNIINLIKKIFSKNKEKLF